MSAHTANVIDLQAYRQSRNKLAPDIRGAAGHTSFVMQPVLMFVPFWGFVPVMAVGIAGHVF